MYTINTALIAQLANNGRKMAFKIQLSEEKLSLGGMKIDKLNISLISNLWKTFVTWNSYKFPISRLNQEKWIKKKMYDIKI